MINMNKFKVILFGMTGFGNSALKVMRGHALIDLNAVFTPKREFSPFPYYECENLQNEVIKSGVALFEGLKLNDKTTYEIIKNISPDLIVVSSFNQIVSNEIISIPRYGAINVHPSLLPKYRGATPTVWALLNNEVVTGVTTHLIEDEKMDCGKIISQTQLDIEPTDTDGILRHKLALLSEDVLNETLKLVFNENKECFLKQDESKATRYPKRTLKDAELDLNNSFEKINNQIRAVSPYPGPILKYAGKIFLVSSIARPDDVMEKKIGLSCEKGSKKLIVPVLNGIAMFYIAKELGEESKR